MATMTEAAAAVDAMKDRLNPVLEKFEENVRQGRRVMVRAQHAAEDGVAAAALQVRRHPVSAVAIAAGAGALAGCMIGFAIGWGCRKSS
ncbi:MAG: hypothetical protein EHM55_13870 [Acidobacteria bacterium]|nr:MAG: hypothetical protein EHM55_13870 [Acidobacteriota bacterium]